MTHSKDDKYLSIEDRLIWSAYVEQENIKGDISIDLPDFEALLSETLTDDVPIKKIPAGKQDKKVHSRAAQAEFKSTEIDRRTAEKLRKGKMRIEARCDLHGLNQEQAYDLLNQFIETARLRGCRCVLVITGKGKSRVSTPMAIEPERGILKQKVPQWLGERHLSPHILKTYTAQPKDGGTGALYVYLRRAR